MDFIEPEDVNPNSKKIRRLMREHDLQPKRRRRFVATTDSDHDCPIFPDLTHNRIVDGPNQLGVADINYIAIVGRLRTDTASRARACVSRCPMALQQTTKVHRQNPDFRITPRRVCTFPGSPRKPPGPGSFVRP